MLNVRTIFPFVLAMTIVVVASNYLVQFPVIYTLGPVNLADLLTWGAFTYPVAFLATDLANRKYGPAKARIVVIFGFAIAVILSIYFATPRIAIASGSAFLIAQLLDVSIFNKLRDGNWWQAPLVSSLLGSFIDTVIFFSLAFSTVFSSLGANDDFAIGLAPLVGIFAVDVPRYVSWALGDFMVKILVGFAMLIPYGIIAGRKSATK